MLRNILFAAGGTGGHIFPAVAVLEELHSRYGSDLSVHWLGSANRMESTMIPRMNIPYTAMPIQGFRGLFSVDTMLLPLRLASSVARARRCIRSFRPHLLIATGAYISFPAALAAKQLRVPYVLMESNANLGKSNRQLAAGAKAIVLSYEESMVHLPSTIQRKAHVLGNPVRTSVVRGGDTSSARLQYGLSPNRPTVLVVGGSLGARSINHAVQAMVLDWAAQATAPFQLLWQTGSNFQAHIPEAVRNSVVSVEFIDDMGLAYSVADLVVGRSGATTLAELGVVGKPAILIPLPSASMGEQLLNARVVEKHGGAVVVTDEALGSDLAHTIHQLIVDGGRLQTMGAAMAALGKPDATKRVADLVESLIAEVS